MTSETVTVVMPLDIARCIVGHLQREHDDSHDRHAPEDAALLTRALDLMLAAEKANGIAARFTR